MKATSIENEKLKRFMSKDASIVHYIKTDTVWENHERCTASIKRVFKLFYVVPNHANVDQVG